MQVNLDHCCCAKQVCVNASVGLKRLSRKDGNEGFAIVWVVMVMTIVTLLPLLLLLPWSHLFVPCKKRRERKIDKEGQKGKKYN